MMVEGLHCIGSRKECESSLCKDIEVNVSAQTECKVSLEYTIETFEVFFLTHKSLPYLQNISPKSEQDTSN